MSAPKSDVAAAPPAPGLRVEKEGSVLRLLLDRPQALNALTPELLKALAKALRDAAKDKEVRCVLLSGEGRGFCAGADLASLKGRGEVNLGEDLRRYFNPVIRALRSLDKPVVAAVHGAAAGAGASLAFACDLRLAAEDAKFHLAFLKVGLAPDSGMSWFLSRALGPARALEKAWLAEPITAAEALAAGLVQKTYPADKLQGEALELAQRLAQLPPQAAALTKRAVWRAQEQGLDAQLDYEAHLQEHLGKTKDHGEGVAAFLEKRAPRFTGA